ncbi:MFS transporter [Demequina sp.]|uniref:MFS transporter n=1 Tax=Demequina sp. TaxID=2050685 RepID=UPI003A865817
MAPFHSAFRITLFSRDYEAAQLLLSSIVVPVLARLGDMLGHRRVLIGSLVVTMIASFALAVAPTFPLFTAAWALQGFYVVWLPLNVAIIFARARQQPNSAALTRKGAGTIVVALQAGAIIGALAGGQLGSMLPLWATLCVPAVLVSIALIVVLLKVPDPGVRGGGTIDSTGASILTIALLAIMGGLSLVRVDGITLWVVGMVALGVVLLGVFVKVEQRTEHPLVDMEMMRSPALWPVIVTAALFGVSVLGAQGPLSTFARTNPAEVGYGLGLTSATASYLIGAYVFSLLVGAGVFSRVSTLTTPRIVLIGATALVALGYLSLIPFHDGVAQVVTCMVIAGLGSGALVAALPAAAAAAAPAQHTGVATGLTNTTKTIGGAFASSAFAIALATGVAGAAGVGGGGGESTAASLSGYITVWAICGGTAVVAMFFLFAVPKVAFTSSADALVAEAGVLDQPPSPAPEPSPVSGEERA